MSVRGYSPSTPNGAGIPYGQPQMGYPNAGGGGGGPPQMMDPNLQQQQMGGGYAMPPGAYNRGTRMEHVSNTTLSNRSFGAVYVLQCCLLGFTIMTGSLNARSVTRPTHCLKLLIWYIF